MTKNILGLNLSSSTLPGSPMNTSREFITHVFLMTSLVVFLAKSTGDLKAEERLAPEFHWARTGFPQLGFADVAVDQNDQIYVLYNLQSGSVLFGETFFSNDGSGTSVVAKLSPAGEFMKNIRLEMSGVAHALAVDHDGGILVGGTVGGARNNGAFTVWGQTYEVWGANIREAPGPGPDAYVLKVNEDGALLWFQHFGGSTNFGTGETLHDIAVDPEGNVAVVGSWRGSGRFGNGVAFAGGESDGYVALFNRDGVHRWIHMIGTPNDGGDHRTTGRGDYTKAVAFDDEGNVIAGGAFKGVIPVGHHVISSREVPKTSPVKYSQDAFVVKIARSGRVLWADAIGGESLDMMRDVTVGPNQEVVVTGSFRGTLSADHGGFESHPNGGTDIFLIRYDPDGVPTLKIKLGADKMEDPKSVITDSSGRIYLFALTGYLEFDDVFILPSGTQGGAMMCFDASGNGLWGMGGFNSLQKAIPLSARSQSQFLVYGSLQIGQYVFEGFSSEFTIQQPGPGAHLLMSIDGAPWPDVSLSNGPVHPADLNRDWRLTINEVTGYGGAWKNGSQWPNEPNPISINYLTRAGAIWKGGETYVWDANIGQAPQGWVNQLR